jgi:hypothetical protein
MGPGVRRDDEDVFPHLISRQREDVTPRSRDMLRPRFANHPPSREGAGKTGCALHPRSRVQKREKNAHEHTGSAEAVRPSLRDGVTVYFALSPVIGLSCHRRPQKACASHELDTSIEASGPHDFAVRERLRSSGANSTSTASHRACRDVRNAPLVGRDGVVLKCVYYRGKAEYFSREGWTGFGDLPDGSIGRGWKR